MVNICVENFELKILSEFKLNKMKDRWMDGKDGLRIAYSKRLSKKYLGRWMEGWMGGWVGGWMDGWMEVKAGLSKLGY